MMMLFSKRRAKLLAVARDLYETAVAQGRLPAFYERLGVADTLDGRFDLVTLHVFLLMRRLGQEGRPARRLAQELFDVMFADMDLSLRELGASDMSMGRRVKTMAKAFYGRLDAYDRGLHDRATLKDALARNLYRGGTVAPEALDAMEAYMVREGDALQTQAFADIAAGKVAFGPPILP